MDSMKRSSPPRRCSPSRLYPESILLIGDLVALAIAQKSAFSPLEEMLQAARLPQSLLGDWRTFRCPFISLDKGTGRRTDDDPHGAP